MVGQTQAISQGKPPEFSPGNSWFGYPPLPRVPAEQQIYVEGDKSHVESVDLSDDRSSPKAGGKGKSQGNGRSERLAGDELPHHEVHHDDSNDSRNC